MTHGHLTSFQIPESYYAALFEAMPGNSLLVNIDAPRFTILAVTPAYLKQINYNREDLIGKGVFEAFPVNDTNPEYSGGKDFLLSYEHVLMHKQSHFLPVQRYDLQSGDGTAIEKYWSTSNSPVLAPNGEVAYIIHTAEDITAQVKTQRMEERMEGLTQAHNLFMQIPNPICILKGPELIVRLANEPMLQLWAKGYEVMGLPLEEAVPDLKGQGFAQMINDVRATGNAKQVYESPVTLMRNGNQEVLYINYTYQPFYDENKITPTGVLVIWHDVTERVLLKQELNNKTKSLQETNEKLNSFLEAVPQIVWTNLPNGEIDFYNQQWFNYTGLNYQQSKDWGWQAVIHPDDLGSTMVTYKDKLQKGEEVVIENRFKRYDGQYRWQLNRAIPIKDNKGLIKFWLGTSTDIHDRKLAEDEIKDSELQFRNLADESPIFVFMIEADPLAPVKYWNKTWLQYTGQSLEEAIGRAWDGIIHPDDVPVVMELYAPAFQSREPYFIPSVRVRRYDGVYRWHAFKGNPRYSANGDFNGFIGVGFDVHQQKLAEEALKQNEVQLQLNVAERTKELETQKAFIATILESSMDGIYALEAVHNADGAITDFRYLFANRNIVKFLNLEMHQILGASMLTLIPENKTNGFFDLFCNVLQTKEAACGETHFVTQGVEGWYDYVIVPIDNEIVVVSIEEVSDKKRAAVQMEEQRNLLDNILKNSSNGISVTEMIRDENGRPIDARTILANDAAVKYIGIPKEIFLSKTAVELDPNILSSPYGQTCLKTLETGEPALSQYYMDLTGRWQELTISKMDDDHLIHIFTDITPIKEVQLQLERYVEDLKRSNQNLEEFAYAASHDLKEPIRKIHIFSDRLKVSLQDKLGAEDKMYFDRMGHATQRMNSLIDDLLLYSHVSRGAETNEMVVLNDKVNKVLEDLELEITEKEAQIMVDDLPTIKGHRRQLQQLFQNLISNAIKYNRPGIAPEVRISSRTIYASDKALEIPGLRERLNNFKYHLIQVSDNGIGFQPEEAERIFNVFTRLHGNAEYKGTGIGLSIVRKVAENHGGYTWAESESGKGATFKVLFPAE
jgi:PAS domain S-box-containing protein